MDILAKLQRNAIRGFGVEISQVYLKKIISVAMATRVPHET